MIETLEVLLPLAMLPTLALLLFSGYTVALVLAATGLLFAGLALAAGLMPMAALYNIPLRVWGSTSPDIS